MPTMMEVAATSTAARRSPPSGKLMLLLTLSPASKVIGKGGGGGVKRLQLADDGEFQCRSCGRRFATFQALGGHRTSHKRPRVRADGLDLLLGARPGGKGGRRASSSSSTPPAHRCDTCGLVFATGQALGGHMRRHRRPLPLQGAGGAAVPTTMTVLSSGSSEHHDDNVDDDDLHNYELIQFI
ncbi:hypothetical protein GUJ93_ZPchr0011g27076 [Zizania palustris]|uniref:C2H2-type domain-containing protein n=1 Tax=Zizania palustris TaxID=103762 RepID=A0A8J5WL47_ZIZPA|nr:hypothetical protein GUJ93_ZPchr0011g27076 [Zizania palustris]